MRFVFDFLTLIVNQLYCSARGYYGKTPFTRRTPGRMKENRKGEVPSVTSDFETGCTAQRRERKLLAELSQENNVNMLAV